MNLPQTLVDINIFVNSVGHLGTSKELKLPVIKQKKITQTAGGFERDINTGTFEKLEAEFTLSEYSPLVFASLAAAIETGVGVNLSCKASIVQNGQKLQAVATLQGDIEIDDGTWKAGGEVERKVKMSVNKYGLVIDNKQALYFDTKNMKAIIDGADYLAKLRSHIQ